MKVMSSHLLSKAAYTSVGTVGWIFLTALKANMGSDLRDAKPMSNVKGRLEELEQCILVLEQEPCDPEEAGISDSEAVSVMMNLMRPREWIHAASPAAWSNVGKLPDTRSKWHTCAELTQAVRELGMK